MTESLKEFDTLLEARSKAHRRMMNAKVAVQYSVPSNFEKHFAELKKVEAEFEKIDRQVKDWQR